MNQKPLTNVAAVIPIPVQAGFSDGQRQYRLTFAEAQSSSANILYLFLSQQWWIT